MSENGRRPGKAARNEQRKAFATTLNAVSVATLVTAVLQPLLGGHALGVAAFAALGVFVLLQGLLYTVLRRLED